MVRTKLFEFGALPSGGPWSAAGRHRLTRVASELPLVPLAEDRVDTAGARSALPPSVPHADAAFSSARAALLGAAAKLVGELEALVIEQTLRERLRAQLMLAL